MKKTAAFLVLLVLVAALAVAACGKGSGNGGGGGGTTINMTDQNFAVGTATAKVGQPVTFNDPATAAEHILCLGQGGQCNKSATGPSELTSGDWTFQPGDSKSVTFTQAGTYHITCTIHPQMDLVLTVS